MKIYIPPKDSYLAPAGTFQAVCVEVKRSLKTIKGKVEEFIRIVFALKKTETKGVRYVVGKNYPVSDLTELYEDLERWLGPRVLDTEFDLHSLPGEEATVGIVHSHNQNFPEAFRVVTAIMPPEQPLAAAA